MITGAVLLPSITVTVIAAPLVLGVVGQQYAAEGTTILRLVALAVIPRAVISLSVATARIDRDVRTMLAVQISVCILTVVSAVALMPRMGLSGAGVAYLGAQTAVAGVLLPRLVGRLRSGGTRAPTVRAAAGRGGGGHTGRSCARYRGGDPTDRAATAFAVALSVAVGVLTVANVHTGLRAFLGTAFLLWVPGATVIGFLDIEDRLLAAVLSVATSVAIGVLGAETMLWVHGWHPRGAVILLALGCTAATGARWLAHRRRGGLV